MIFLSLLIGGKSVLASTNQPPQDAKDFAEKYFHQIVKDVVFSENPSEWGFNEEIGTITFSELYPIYSLNADFALGQSDEMITQKQPKWVAVIFQDNQPVNVIGTEQKDNGNFELAEIGYPSELSHGLLNLKVNEILIHDFPSEEYYVFSVESNSIMKVEQGENTKGLSSLQSKEQFQSMMMERYKNINDLEEDSSGGFMQVPVNQSSNISAQSFIYSSIIVLVLGGSWFYIRRHLKAKKQ